MTMVFFENKDEIKRNTNDQQYIKPTFFIEFTDSSINLIARLISRVWLNTQFFSVYGRLYEIIGEYCHNVLLLSIDSPS